MRNTSITTIAMPNERTGIASPFSDQDRIATHFLSAMESHKCYISEPYEEMPEDRDLRRNLLEAHG
jgi:hypothetical protein